MERSTAGAPARPPRRFSCREVVIACLERWREQAAHAGGIRVYWDAGPAMIEGDATAAGAGPRQPDLQRARARRPARRRDRCAGRRSDQDHGRKRRRDDRGAHDAAIRVAATGRRSSRRWQAPTAAGLRSARPAAAASRHSSCRWPSRVTPGGVSRRARALVFLIAALRLRGARRDGRGPLPLADRVPATARCRPVVVATAELPAGEPIGPPAGGDGAVGAAGAGELRPARGADAPGRCRSAGRRPRRSRPARMCSGPSWHARSPMTPREPGVAAGLRPVQVAVAGAEALTVGGAAPEGKQVDVVVSTTGGPGPLRQRPHRATAREAARACGSAADRASPGRRRWRSPSSRRSR